jgi:hypothetical protein
MGMRWAVGVLSVAAFGCGGATSDATGQTAAGGTGAAAGSGGGTAGTGAGGSGASGGSGGSAGGAGSGGSAGGGGSVGTGGGSAGSGGGSAGSGGNGGGGGLVGSFNLALPVVAQSKMPLGAKSPTPGTVVRLDLRLGATGYEAVLTPSFGAETTMKVDLQPAALILTGPVEIETPAVNGNNVRDTWSAFTFARAADGSLGGAVHAIGDEEAFGGDVVDMATITGDGMISADATVPLVKLALGGSGGPKAASLPWDDFAVRLSEGVDVDALLSALSISKNGGALDAKKTAAPVGWPGAITTHVLLTSWDVGNGALDVATKGGVIADPSGNFALPFTVSVPVLAVPPAQAVHTFDGDVVFVTPWGLTTFPGSKPGTDPTCEIGGCVQLGPIDVGYCATDEAGFAGRLAVDGKTQIAVRYRIFTASMNVTLPPLAIALTTHAGVTTTVSPNAVLAPVTGDLPFATAWSTEVIPVPPGATGELGFVLRAATAPGCGFVPPKTKARIVIDRIETM